ncbi:NUDIX hydrolase domain-like protein [Fusarium flagelliforme]|uniref:NUDIX hydrolase domain-like protein n=1 Tax=Fusarium flagelliforme TaxID=2675880 RepID=UPI001E8DC011|nr:NUDIX hydrolase domain-like protein [Fusarium flagelliforme]KAH7193756.1 NUDIX hydrolase domain-like protein [Fusarium flagelliforme]
MILSTTLFTTVSALMILQALSGFRKRRVLKRCRSSHSSSAMNFLQMSNTAALDYARNILFTKVDKITVGAAILHKNKRSILMLKRAAHETYYPNVFELPGGKVDGAEKIHDAIVREVKEETGLTVTKVITSLAPFTYFTEKTVKEKIILRTTLQLSYVVEVKEDGDGFVVDSEEHSEGRWVKSDEADGVVMTGEMRKLVFQALQMK